MSDCYLNYLELSVEICTEQETVRFLRENGGVFADGVKALYLLPDGTRRPVSMAGAELEREDIMQVSYSGLVLKLTDGAILRVRIFRDRVEMEGEASPNGWRMEFVGDLCWGETEDCFAMCLRQDEIRQDLRSALGPAVSIIDDALFNRQTDEALTVEGGEHRALDFDWTKEKYTFTVGGKLTLGIRSDVYRQKFRLRYRPINKRNTFPTPPVGWMTWYAVKFGACERAVLENAAKQKEYFADYGANAIWVDWEWYHSNLEGKPAPDDIGFMNPDRERYPNGLRYVSDKIREIGFTPALWVAPTNEPAETETVKKYKDCVHLEKPTWCGRYFFDITDERVRDELIPAAFAKVTEWGYDALKWDCLPLTLHYTDIFRHTLKHPEMSSAEAMRAVVKKARETVGKEMYMLSCSGNDRVVMLASEDFDGARIGNDIFTWQEFISNFMDPILRLYPLHNTLLYCDPDNLVVREEFNNPDQARSRASAVSLLGLPVTLGDDLRTLSHDRVELIRRALPPPDAHPKDLSEGTHDGRRFLINLAINRPFEAWNTAALMNLLEEEATLTLNIAADLKLPPGEYLVWDYWNDRFVGKVEDSLTLTLPAMATAVLSVRRAADHPRILSTSRHVTQGIELHDVRWDEASLTLTVTADTVKGDPYKIRIYVPEGYVPEEGSAADGVLTVIPDTNGGRINCAVRFRRK